MLDFNAIDQAINIVSVEKNIPKEKLLEIIEQAVKMAYKRDYASKEANVNVSIDLAAEKMEITIEKEIVATDDDIEDEDLQISYDEIGGAESGYEIGDMVELDVSDDIINSDSFGRIASQVAKQVIVQKISETEKEKIYHLFKDKVGEIVSMKVDSIESIGQKTRILLSYNGNQIPLPKSEQYQGDRYKPGQRMNFYVRKAEIDEEYGPIVALTRKDREFIIKLFENNTPELEDGTVEIISIARIPGVKTKIIVASENADVDPAGCLIGPKGTRVRTIVEELFGEKIDVLNYTTNKEEMIRRALVPGIVEEISIDEENNTINAVVKNSEKAKVLGRGGTNINIAGDLLGYKINLTTIMDDVNEENSSAE